MITVPTIMNAYDLFEYSFSGLLSNCCVNYGTLRRITGKQFMEIFREKYPEEEKESEEDSEDCDDSDEDDDSDDSEESGLIVLNPNVHWETEKEYAKRKGY